MGRDDVNQRIKKAEQLAKIMQMSKAMQRRYTLIPSSALNNTTVAGIRDMRLGRIKNGKPVGGNVIRFNNASPNTKSDFPRICIDPNGVSNKANPHIPVSANTVATAAKVQKGLKLAGTTLFVISLVANGVRIVKAVYDEITIDEEIEALKETIDCLEEDLRTESSDQKSRKESLQFAKELLAEAYENKKNPGKKTLITIVTIGGEYAGAAAVGLAGAEAGAAIGLVGGPIGSVAGAVAGGLVGALVGSELGQSAVQNCHT